MKAADSPRIFISNLRKHGGCIVGYGYDYKFYSFFGDNESFGSNERITTDGNCQYMENYKRRELKAKRIYIK